MFHKTVVRQVLFPRTPRSVLLALSLVLWLIFFGFYTNFNHSKQVEAATSSTINFQARLMSASGNLVPDGIYNMQFDLYNVSSGGSTLWTEDRLVTNTQGVTIKNGYLSVALSQYDAFPGTINWDEEHWLGMTVRGTASCAWGSCTPADSEMTPRIKLTAVPYALMAGKLQVTSSGITNTLTFATPASSNKTITIANASGTVAVSASGNIALNGSTGDISLTGQIPIANGGTNATTAQAAINNLSGLTTNGDLLYHNGTNSTRLARGGNGECLTSNATTILWGTCAAGSTTTLQQAYGYDTDTGDTIIALDANDDSLIFRNPASGGSDSTYILTLDQLATGAKGGLSVQSAGTGNLLLISDTTATAADVLTIADGGSTTFKTQTNSTTGFQIQNAAGASLFSVDTSTSVNLVTNGHFETDTSGWALKGSATIARTASHQEQGNASLGVTTTAAANDGAKYNLTLTSSTAYTLSFWAKVSATAGANLSFGYAQDGSTETGSTTSLSQTSATQWTKYSLGFTTGTVSGTPYFFVKQSDATARVIYIDAVQIEAGSVVSPFTPGGQVQLLGSINSPVNIKTTQGGTALTLQATTSQTSNLFEAKKSDGTTTAYFDNNGSLRLNIPSGSDHSGIYMQGGGDISSEQITYNTSNVLGLGDGGGHVNVYTRTGLNVYNADLNSDLFTVNNQNATYSGNIVALNTGGGTPVKFDAAANYLSYGTNNSLLALATPAFTTGSSGSSYYYKLTATNAQGETVGSASLGMANNTSTLNWTQINGATGYKLYRNSIDDFTSGSLLRTTITTGATVSFADTGAATGAGLPPTAPTGTKLTAQAWQSQTGNIIQTTDSSSNVLSGFESGGQLFLGRASALTGSSKYYNASGAGSITLQAANPGASSYTITLPAETGTVCTTASGGACSALGFYIQNQSAGQQSSSNFWISGTGRADTSFTTPLLDTPTAVALALGTTNATAINLNQNTAIAANKNLTMASGTGIFTQTYSSSADAHSITANSLTTGTGLKVTTSNNTAADTAWNGLQFNLTNAQGTTAVSTGSIYGADFEFTQNTSIAGNTEAVANFAVKQNDSSSTDATVASILNVANNDTATGNQITVTDGLKITGTNITNGINLSGTFGTNLITSTNFSLLNAGYLRATNGNATTPAYSFSGQTGTGLYYNGGSAVGISIAGTDRLFIDGAGVILPNLQLRATDGDEVVKFTDVATAVNELYLSNAATGNSVILGSSGTDTDVGINITPKGAGAIILSGSTTASANLAVNGNITLGDAITDTITFTGRVNSHILPITNDTYDLGSDALRWKDIYLGGETIHLGASTADEATLSYTSGSDAFALSTATAGGTIAIGTTNGTGQITLGSSSAAQTVVIGNGAGAATVSIANVSTAGNTVNISTAANTVADTINIGTGATTAASGKTIHIADGTPTGSGTNVVTIGSISGAANTTTIQGGNGATAINLSAAASGNINIGTNAVTGKVINIGSVGSTANATTLHIADTTDATVTQVITIGSKSNAANTTTIQGGSGSAIALTPQTTGTIVIGASAGTGQITVGSSSATQTVVIGDGSGAASTVNIANTTVAGATVSIAGGANTSANSISIANGATAAATTVSILSGVGTASTATLSLGNNTRVTQIDLGNIAAAAARTLNIGSGSNTVAIDTLNFGTGNTTVAGGKTIHIGDGTPSGSGTNLVTIGSIAALANTTLIQGGNVNTAGSEAIRLQTSAAGGIAIGTATQTGTITLGQSTAGQIINIGGAQVANGNTQTIHIGDSATGTGKDLITIGNTNAASSLTLQGGTAGINLTGVAPDSAAGAIATVSGTLSSTTNQFITGLKVTPTITVGSSANIGFFGATFAPTTATANLDQAQSAIAGALFQPTYTGTGTINTIAGLSTFPTNSSTGTVASVLGFTTNNPINSGGGTIQRATGVLVVDQTVGTISNVNVLLGTSTVPVGNYSIYSASAYQSYIAGALGIGTDTTPTGALQVTGDEVRIGDAGTVDVATGDGDLYVEDALEVDGNISFGDAITDTITFTGRVNSHILPITNDTYDLGSDALRWKDIYLGGETIHLGASTADEATLSYTSGSDAFALSTATAGGTITLGSTTQTGTITLGQSTASNTISIGAAAGASNTQTINIGTSATASSTTNVNIGSTIGGTMTLQSGPSASINFNTPTLLLTEATGSRSIVAQTRTTNVAGTGIVILAGAAGSGATGVAGGDLTLQSGGAAGTSGAANGGTVGIEGGAGVNGGVAGQINIGTVNGSGITLGSTSTTAGLVLGQSTGSNTIAIGNANTATGNTQTINIGAGTPAGTGKATITIGNTTNDSSVTLRAGTGFINLGATQAQFTEVTGTRTLTVQTRTTNVAGSGLTIAGGTAGTGGSAFSGGILTLQGGNAAGTGNAHGANVVITGGTGVGTGVKGLIVVDTTTFSASTVQNFTANANITQANIDTYGSILISGNVAGWVATLTDPTITTTGRVIYITNSGSVDITLAANTVGTALSITLKPASTATMYWNGTDWTAAGASSSTDLQAAYNNTATSAGGAEIVLSSTGTGGLTIRNDGTTPITGGLLEVQTSIGSNLFTVNNNATEYANNGGAESATFTMWAAAPAGGSVSRYTTAGNNIATGAGSVFSDNTSTANTGIKNTLTTSLTANLKYKVSYTVRHVSSTVAFNTLDTIYSSDGTSTTQTCASASVSTYNTWTRIDCSFTATAVGASNAIIIRHSDAVEHDFYIDNLSVTVSADVSHGADGSVDAALGTNWTAYDADGGAGTSTPTRDTTNIYDTSGAVADVTTAHINEGVRNNMSITPSINTQYLVTFYAKLLSGTFTDMTVGFLPAGGSSAPASAQLCADYNTRTLSTSSWTKITCIFTTPGSGISDPDLVIYQPTATARTFYVDALSITLNTNNSNNVQIGGGNKGGPTTLFTLDRSNGAPIAANNDAYLGSMYYDTSSGRIQCYEADGWGACGAAPDNIVNLNPEYAGAVLNGSGVGTMTADFCSDDTALTVNATLCETGQAKNFYKWTSPQASQQTYSIYVTYQLPATFNGFSSDDTVQLVARTDSLTNAAVTYEMFKSTGSAVTACGTETTVVTTADTWQSVGINGNEATGCSFTSGSASNFIIFKINTKANSNANAYVSTLSFTTTGR